MVMPHLRFKILVGSKQGAMELFDIWEDFYSFVTL